MCHWGGDVKTGHFYILTYVHFGGGYRSFLLWRNLRKIIMISLKLVSKKFEDGVWGHFLKSFHKQNMSFQSYKDLVYCRYKVFQTTRWIFDESIAANSKVFSAIWSSNNWCGISEKVCKISFFTWNANVFNLMCLLIG